MGLRDPLRECDSEGPQKANECVSVALSPLSALSLSALSLTAAVVVVVIALVLVVVCVPQTQERDQDQGQQGGTNRDQDPGHCQEKTERGQEREKREREARTEEREKAQTEKGLSHQLRRGLANQGIRGQQAKAVAQAKRAVRAVVVAAVLVVVLVVVRVFVSERHSAVSAALLVQCNSRSAMLPPMFPRCLQRSSCFYLIFCRVRVSMLPLASVWQHGQAENTKTVKPQNFEITANLSASIHWPYN